MSMDKNVMNIECAVCDSRETMSNEDVQNYRYDLLVDTMTAEGRLQEAIDYKWARHIYNTEKKKVGKDYDWFTNEFKSVLREA